MSGRKAVKEGKGERTERDMKAGKGEVGEGSW